MAEIEIILHNTLDSWKDGDDTFLIFDCKASQVIITSLSPKACRIYIFLIALNRFEKHEDTNYQ